MAQDLICRYGATEEVAKAVVEDFITYSNECIAKTGSCIVGLSGGTTPNAMFSLMNEPEYMKRIDWEQIFFLWVDERFVPHEDPDNNFGRAKRRLFENIAGCSHYYPMPTNSGLVEEAAKAYEREVKTVLNACEKEAMDLVFLGLGDDGHTASLFPKSEALYEKEHFVTYVKDGKVWNRITMTFPFLATAKEVWFTVVGEAKAVALAKVLQQRKLYRFDPWEKRVSRTLPGAVLTQENIRWYVDETAAHKL